jgi:4-amino-4-deoxy-L-arabinose transferase-like glycosyltransferase
VAVALALRLHGMDWGLPLVYEEAYPFKKAWDMWGWGADAGFDLNPHFFNYPTLFFYVQLAGQAFTFGLLRLLDVFAPEHPWGVASSLDIRALYTLDKTPFYLVGRGISVLFAAATVIVTWKIGRRVGGAAAAAALLVGLNHFHISKSQVIEVDVPLTLFVLLACLFALRILEVPTRRNYVLAGLFCGLATSTKYSGALLPLAILVAHFVALRRFAPPDKAPAPSPKRVRRKPGASRPPGSAAARSSLASGVLWRRLLLSGVVAVAALFLTSPYILLDSDAFWAGFNYERQHMNIGHFGLDDSPALQYYAGVLATSLLGWPLAIASLAGLLYLIVVRRAAWAMVLAVFPIVYVSLISSWSMKAERYVMPLMPLACLLAAAATADVVRRARPATPRLVPATVAALALVCALPTFAYYDDVFRRARGDTRTLARDWLEENAADGSFLVTEAYGPEPFHAIDMANVAPDLRERIEKARAGKKMFGYLQLPMLQVQSDVVSIFYDLNLYTMADYMITSTGVSTRYKDNPGRYAQMLRFYADVERRYTKVAEFGEPEGAGPRLTIYKNPQHSLPFRERPAALPPIDPPLRELMPRTAGPHYQRLAANYETLGFYAQAAILYELAGRYEGAADFARSVAVGAVRNFLQANRPAEAYAVMQREEARAGSEAMRAYWRDLRESVFKVEAQSAAADSSPP